MSRFETILVPTDFGESAELALDHAITIGRAMSSKIVLLYACPLLTGAALDGSIVPSPEVIEMMQEAGRKGLARAIENRKNCGVEIRSLETVGDPRSCILDAAKQNGADLIVMGTHGRHGVSRFLFGSTAEAIVRTSPIPVLTVRGPAPNALQSLLAQGVGAAILVPAKGDSLTVA